MPIAPKIADFNIVDIDTTVADVQTSPGMAGVAVIQQGQSQGLQTYYSLNDVAGDYDNNSYVYQAASNYFDNPNATTFQVISYLGNLKPVNIPDDLKPYENVDVNKIINTLKPGSSNYDNIANLYNQLTNGKNAITSVNDIPNDKYGLNTTKHMTSSNLPQPTAPIFSDINAAGAAPIQQGPTVPSIALVYIAEVAREVQSLLAQNKKAGANDNAVTALTKYYNSGAEFFIFEVANQNDQQTAIDLSNLVEGQQNGMLFLDQPTNSIGTDDDFKWYQPIASNRSTVLFSMPYSGDPANYQFVPNVLARYAGGNPASNLELTNSLPNIQPQDYYNFTDQDFKVYQSNGVITYCYRNDIPMLSSGNSASRYQVSNMITRDYLNNQISHGISGAIINAHNDGDDIHFDQNGVNQIVAIIETTLSSAVQAGYIKNPSVHSVNVDKIPEQIKEEGYLNGLSYEWAPNNNINDVTFHQVINVPLMTQSNK